MNRNLGRRALLGGLGATTAAATFLRPILAQTQTGAAPQRLLIIHRPCGSAMDASSKGAPSFWWPSSGASGGTDYVVAPDGLIDSFKAVRNQMVVMKGLDCPRIDGWYGDKHGSGMAAMISPPPADRSDHHAWPIVPGREGDSTNDPNAKGLTATDRSIDQLFVNTIPTLVSPAAIPSLELTPDLISAQASNFFLRVISYAKDNPSAAQPTPLHPQPDPAIVFKNVFGKVMGGTDGAAVARQLAQNKSVIDFINGDLNSLRPRLPKLARDKVDTHLAAIRQLEIQQTANGSGRQCMPPTLAPVNGTVPDGTALDGQASDANDSRFHQTALDHFELIKSAFLCDLTRVITFTYSWGNSGIRFKNVVPALLPNLKMDDGEGWHGVSHNSGSNPGQGQFIGDKYFCTMTAKLLADLAATPDGVNGGSLLDNTLVVYWNECSVGNAHGVTDMPVLLFGGKFLNLQGGKYFDFKSKPGGKRYMSDLWTEVSKRWAMAPGVAGSNYEPLTKYGADQWNLGDVAELFT